jgi:hypothetical protein
LVSFCNFGAHDSQKTKDAKKVIDARIRCMEKESDIAYFLQIPDLAWRNSGNNDYMSDRVFSGIQFWEVPECEEVALLLSGKFAGKGKVVPVLNLSKHYAMNAYGGVDVGNTEIYNL